MTTPTPQQSAAASRALALAQERLEADTRAAAQQQQSASQIAVADGAGKFRQPGGNRGYRPRGIVTSGAIPNGQIVPANGGRIGGMPAGFGGDAEAIRLLQERAAQVDLTAGTHVVNVHPNDVLGDESNQRLSERRPGDPVLYQGVKYYWESSEGMWMGLLEELTVSVASPAVQQYPAIGYSPYRRRVESLTILNRNTDGTTATAGTGALLVNGGAVTLGTTLLPQGGYLALNVTSAGEGLLVASITVRAA